MITNAEKIAALVYGNAAAAAKYGQVVYIGLQTPWFVRVEINNGPCVLIRASLVEWEVSFKGISRKGRDLIETAQNALDAGNGIDVTRNVEVLMSDVF